MKRIYITAIPLDSNFAIAPYAAQAANYQQTYTAPSCYPITPIIADTARPGDEITVLAVRQKNSFRSDNLDAFRRELDTLGTPHTLIDVTTPENQQRDALLTLMHARTAGGQWLSGVAAFEVAYAAVGLAWVMAPARIPLLRAGMNALYPVVARNRYRVPGWVIRTFFGKALRRAAERAAAQQCTDQCMR